VLNAVYDYENELDNDVLKDKILNNKRI